MKQKSSTEFSKRESERISFQREAKFLPITTFKENPDLLTKSYVEEFFAKVHDENKAKSGYMRILETRLVFKCLKAHKKRLIDVKFSEINNFFVFNRSILCLTTWDEATRESKVSRISLFDPESAEVGYEKLFIYLNRSQTDLKYEVIRDKFPPEHMVYVRNMALTNMNKFPRKLETESLDNISEQPIEEMFVNKSPLSFVEFFSLNEKSIFKLAHRDINRVHVVDNNAFLMEIMNEGRPSHYCYLTPANESTFEFLINDFKRNHVKIIRTGENDNFTEDSEKYSDTVYNLNDEKPIRFKPTENENVYAENELSSTSYENKVKIISRDETMMKTKTPIVTRNIIDSLRSFHKLDPNAYWHDEISVINTADVTKNRQGNIICYVAHKQV